jgi:endoglucanase
MERKDLEFLENLCNAPSPSGFEEPATKVWSDYLLKNLKVEPISDIYGNCISKVVKKDSCPQIMLCGHIDEVGFMVRYVNDDGFVYLSSIGGINPNIMPAKQILIYNKNGPVLGVVGTTPIHCLDEDYEEELKIHSMYVDIGAIDKEDALSKISIGDPATFNMKFEYLTNNRVAARGFDDKMGAWVVARSLVELNKYDDLDVNICGVASVQEETGGFGALMSAYNVNPDIALAIDVGFATDTPDAKVEKFGSIKLGDGPIISIGSIINKKVSNSLIKTSEYCRIPSQIFGEPKYSGTDADNIFTIRGGIPTGVLSVPSRYMHTPVEVIHIDDLDNTVKLIVEWCKSIANEF